MQRFAGILGVAALSVLFGPTPARAGDAPDAVFVVAPSRPSPWVVSFVAIPESPAAGARFDLPDLAWDLDAAQDRSGVADDDQQPRGRAVAFAYSDGYRLRRKIHYIASFATIPLFATQYALGRKLFDGTGSGGTRTAHIAVASSIGVLFGVNTVTGVWNLVEARKDPNGRTKRTVHGLLMLAADAGFVATAALAPGRDGSGDRSTHRAVALTSIAVATTGYLIMLFGR